MPPQPGAKRPSQAARPVDSFEAAVRDLDQDPAAALAYLEHHPETGERAQRSLALRVVALYDLERYPECSDLVRDIQRQRGDLLRLARDYPRLARILERERRERHLSVDLRGLPSGPPWGGRGRNE